MDVTEEMEPDSPDRSPAKGSEATSCSKEEDDFHHEGGSALAQAAPGGCGISVLGGLHSSRGQGLE